MIEDYGSAIERYYTLLENLKDYDEDKRREVLRHLCLTDLYFFIIWALNRKDFLHPWLYARTKEVELNPNGYLDLWARDHRKSTLITFALSIQDILSSHGNNPLPKWKGREATIAIFSVTRPIAKAFLGQIKEEFERNEKLKYLFPDVVWQNPSKESPKWSLDGGLVFKRQTNPKEATVEAWGVVEGQPTSKHFLICVYDDLVSIENVRSPTMIEKTLRSWELSLNLSTDGGIHRYIGTRYHFNDTYKTIIERGAAVPRIYAATDNALPDGAPVFLPQDVINKKRMEMGPYTFAAQMLLNPVADDKQTFKQDWVSFTSNDYFEGLNLWILVDPANSKKTTSDYTAIVVIGLGSDYNYYLVDAVRDRLNLKERGDALFRLHRKYRPIGVGYESYGMQADINYIQERMDRENYHFHIETLKGRLSKEDRIRRLIPVFEQKRFLFPECIHKTNYEGKTQNLVDVLINEELLSFPFSEHDDMLDAMARILDDDLGTFWPSFDEGAIKEDRYSRQSQKAYNNSSWGA